MGKRSFETMTTTTNGLGSPRTLVVGQGFNMTTGGGITLSSLFEGWDKDALASVTWPIPASSRTACERVHIRSIRGPPLVAPYHVSAATGSSSAGRRVWVRFSTTDTVKSQR